MSVCVGPVRKPHCWFSHEAEKHRKWTETGNFGFRKKRNYTIRVAKTKALIAVTAKLICAFVFAYAECWFSHDAAKMTRDGVFQT